MAWTKNHFKTTCYHEAGHVIARLGLGFTVAEVRFYPEPDPEVPESERFGGMTLFHFEGESDPTKFSDRVLYYHAIGTRAGELAEVSAFKRGLIKRVSEDTLTNAAIGYEQVGGLDYVEEDAQKMVDLNWDLIESLALQMYRTAKDDLEDSWTFKVPPEIAGA